MSGQTRIDSNLIETGTDPNDVLTVSDGNTLYAKTETFTTTIAVADWTGSDPYVATMTVSGILSTDVPIVDLNLSSVTFADVPDVQGVWATVYRVEASADDEVKFYATEEPTKDLTVRIQVVR